MNKSATESMPVEFPVELRVFFNSIYEFKKGVRKMVLCTIPTSHVEYAIQRLMKQQITFYIQKVNQNTNVFFGEKSCIETIKNIVDKPLNKLTAEQDFILGALLGYDICKQCERFNNYNELSLRS